MKLDYITLFKQEDFNRMTIRVMGDESPKEHAFFANNKVYENAEEKLLKYICLFYDPKSPLLNKFSNHIERKKCAAVLAGWNADKKTKAFDPQVEDILYCRDKNANIIIIEYLRGLKNDLWSVLCTGREALYLIELDLMSEATSQRETTKTNVEIATARTKLSREAEDMADRLSARTLDFLSQDESPYIKAHLFDLVDLERRLPRTTPERQLLDADA